MLLTDEQRAALERLTQQTPEADGWIEGLDDTLESIGVPYYTHTSSMLATARWLLRKDAECRAARSVSPDVLAQLRYIVLLLDDEGYDERVEFLTEFIETLTPTPEAPDGR